MNWYDTLLPYKILPEEPIQYGVCKDFEHISRYRNLRQVVHGAKDNKGFVSLETSNPFHTNLSDVVIHEVSNDEENRLDIISQNYLGSAHYSWIIAYMNDIEDGYSIREGMKLKIPKSITALMQNGELLQNISAMQLNLGVE